MHINQRLGRFLKRSIATVAMVTAASGAAGALAVSHAAPAAASVTVGGVSASSSAYLNSCERRVYVQATSHEPVWGRYTVYFRAHVYDYATGRWNVSGWRLANGITNIWLRAYRPYAYAYVDDARVSGGYWRYSHEYVAMSQTLDSGYSVWGC
jgi:hypothetical protein